MTLAIGTLLGVTPLQVINPATLLLFVILGVLSAFLAVLIAGERREVRAPDAPPRVWPWLLAAGGAGSATVMHYFGASGEYGGRLFDPGNQCHDYVGDSGTGVMVSAFPLRYWCVAPGKANPASPRWPGVVLILLMAVTLALLIPAFLSAVGVRDAKPTVIAVGAVLALGIIAAVVVNPGPPARALARAGESAAAQEVWTGEARLIPDEDP